MEATYAVSKEPNWMADPDKAHICPVCGGHRTQEEGSALWWCEACEQERREERLEGEA